MRRFIMLDQPAEMYELQPEDELDQPYYRGAERSDVYVLESEVAWERLRVAVEALKQDCLNTKVTTTCTWEDDDE